MIATVSRLVELIQESHVLDASQLATLTDSLQAEFPEPHPLATEMLRRGWLTDYQLAEVIKGRGQDLVLGPYVILERVGRGSMGDVFKARRQKDGQVIALKVIRQERRSDVKALSRFRREVEALTQLSHPNIVTACDIDEIGVAHYYAMEFVEGIDLDDFIARSGPLPVAPACDFIRQAADGLQHAHERGLIHRDIKPGNLVITPPGPPAKTSVLANGRYAEARTRFGHWGVIKILDLGLVLLSTKAAGDEQFNLTQPGFSLGTADYMPPEQTTDPHSVDIRADLYSLGCTFYDMLTGKPPFPTGTMIEKLRAHMSQDPVPVNQVRPEVPQAVADVVAKLLAKKPADRYQTPGELAAALTGILAHMEPAALNLDWTPTCKSSATIPVAPSEAAPPPESSPPQSQWQLITALVIFVITLIIFLIALGR
jgi:serine/threonine protein kinase